MPTDRILEVELEAYVDDQLNLERRYAVEDYLARSPEDAARVMADLRAMTALRMMNASLQLPHDERHSEAVRQLAGTATRRPMWRLRTFAVAAAAIASIGSAWVIQSDADSGSELLAEALMSHRTAVMRAGMASQFETAEFDANELQSQTGIRIPVLLPGWHVRDVQVFPSDAGPALQMMIDTPSGRTLSLFAMRTGAGAPMSPTARRTGQETVAFWRRAGTSYVLTGDKPVEELDAVAENLADNAFL